MSADDPDDQSVAAKIERELRALLPAALAVAESYNANRQATAQHLIKVVMVTVRSRLPPEPDPP